MKLIGVKNTVLIVIGKDSIPLVTLKSHAKVRQALLWTRKKGDVIEGASALLDYCKGLGLKPKGRAIGKKRCEGLAGQKAGYTQ